MPGRFFQPVAGRSGLFRRRRRPSIGSPGERCEREFPVEDVVAGSGAGHPAASQPGWLLSSVLSRPYRSRSKDADGLSPKAPFAIDFRI